MTQRHIAAIDQGTTSSRCIIFDDAARVVSVGQREHQQIFRRPAGSSTTPQEIWRNVQAVIDDALGQADLRSGDIAALGITNQRETTVLWDRATGAPVANAIVWQDTRTDAPGATSSAATRGRTGSASAAACRWPPTSPAPRCAGCWTTSRACASAPRPARSLFGTIDTWLIWNLTGRHVTDVTNASRTMLMDLETLAWDDGLLEAFGVPRAMLPEIRSSAEVYGEARGRFGRRARRRRLGDQQAALFGQTCFAAGEAKCTYGTGCFLLLNTGTQAGALRQRAAHHGRLPDRRRAGRLRAGRLHRGRRLARAVAARQPGPDRQRRRDRDAGPHGRRQRRLLLRAGVLRACSPRTGAATPAASSPA